MLPDPDPADPGTLPLAGQPTVPESGCPSTPGLITADNYPTGVTIGGNFSCTLKPGLYVFENTNLDVPATASIASYQSDGTDGLPAHAGVTLVFYGSSTMTVEGHIGILIPGGGGERSPLIASDPDIAWQAGQPIPGVAIVFDQFGTTPAVSRLPFTLGDDFDITGSIYALDGQTTWATNSGDCLPETSTCAVHDFTTGESVIATTATAFSDPDPNGIGRIPTVATDHAMVEPPPSPPHLVK
jgi:hypothetical protein